MYRNRPSVLLGFSRPGCCFYVRWALNEAAVWDKIGMLSSALVGMREGVTGLRNIKRCVPKKCRFEWTQTFDEVLQRLGEHIREVIQGLIGSINVSKILTVGKDCKGVSAVWGLNVWHIAKIGTRAFVVMKVCDKTGREFLHYILLLSYL